MNGTTETGTARYRTRTAEVEAIRYRSADNLTQVAAFLADNPYQYDLEPGDWITRDDDKTYEIYTEQAFKAEFEPVVETEYGWDGIVVEHPQTRQYRLPLAGGKDGDGVLVLDREYMLLLAATIQDLLAGDGNPGRTANNA